MGGTPGRVDFNFKSKGYKYQGVAGLVLKPVEPEQSDPVNWRLEVDGDRDQS